MSIATTLPLGRSTNPDRRRGEAADRCDISDAGHVGKEGAISYGRTAVTTECPPRSRRGGGCHGYRSIQFREASARHGQEGEGCGEDELELEEEEELDGPRLSNEEIMERVADLHRRYDDGQMDLDTFDEEKAALMAQMVID